MDTAGLLIAVFDAANRRDLDAAAALADPEFVGVVPSSMSAEPDAYRGRDGVRRYYESFWEMVDGLTVQLEEMEVHGDWTIARGHASGTGRTSGAPFENYIAIAAKSRDGLLMRMQAFPDMDEARAGISGSP